MMRKGYRLSVWVLTGLLLVCPSGCRKDAPVPEGGEETPSPADSPAAYEATEEPNPFSWVAVDGQGSSLDPDTGRYPDVADRGERTVGIFYFLWHGCHGYDHIAISNSVLQPTAADAQSPFDIQKLLDANPAEPAFGPLESMHHWGEPYLGYYVMNDDWVIRKHAQMLSDAGVDVIIFDVTNLCHYLPVVENLARVFTEVRHQGGKTPQFAFLLNTDTGERFEQIYNGLYAKGLYSELWFRWLGKPLVLADPDAVPGKYHGEFTFRRSWFLWNDPASDTWFGNGEDKWPWGSVYPQQAGTHEGKVEFACAMPATHPISNIGRSFDVVSNTEPRIKTPEKGLYFKKQFEQAMSLNPQFLFFTGWNEWTAQRFDASYGFPPPYFVDQYNHEFSRDIEPLNGGFGDNYYYLMVDFIRKFKGTRRLPSFSERKEMKVDGSFDDWSGVAAQWGDDRGDTFHRDHFGWGRIGQYVNDTGRNDIVLTKAVNDGTNLYFYVRTAAPLSPSTDRQWMQLFLLVDAKAKVSWEGYGFVVNRTAPSGGRAVLEKNQGGWKWTKAADIPFKVSGNEMELSLPLSALGITDPKQFTVDFKWVDNAVSDGDIQTCMRDGDSAPNGRFRYRYKFISQ